MREDADFESVALFRPTPLEQLLQFGIVHTFVWSEGFFGGSTKGIQGQREDVEKLEALRR